VLMFVFLFVFACFFVCLFVCLLVCLFDCLCVRVFVFVCLFVVCVFACLFPTALVELDRHFIAFGSRVCMVACEHLPRSPCQPPTDGTGRTQEVVPHRRSPDRNRAPNGSSIDLQRCYPHQNAQQSGVSELQRSIRKLTFSLFCLLLSGSCGHCEPVRDGACTSVRDNLKHPREIHNIHDASQAKHNIFEIYKNAQT
jgi:hypothetical protein